MFQMLSTSMRFNLLGHYEHTLGIENWCEVSTFQLRFFTHKFELIILLKGSYSRFTQMNVKLMLLSLWGHKIKLEHTPTTTKDVLLC
ncbi:hypothetical protein GLYMA_10G137300v4 [Glycine max]|uniref:Uncharacterized protein n=2 Tax=Glycine subgen. Soja TaxID=1462606 RepID=A0A0R0HT34_SOYBN|nr:hypothetical protein JHK87_028010 [Glycine soja]KAH1138111.1 hypothetical protein GYH30_027928 [Glycine max]KRH33638.1 hypothetical protein GLYMA_10G137300v4 [Glycine max]RZB87113.1 hypothetical protein D0Y65_027001 [Glycine soja]